MCDMSTAGARLRYENQRRFHLYTRELIIGRGGGTAGTQYIFVFHC